MRSQELACNGKQARNGQPACSGKAGDGGKPANTNHLYNLGVGLLYPAVLGAGLAWLIQGFSVLIGRGLDGYLPIGFAVCFLVAYASAYVRSVDKYQANSQSYDCRAFGLNVAEIAAVGAGFWFLGIVSSGYPEPNFCAVYIIIFIASCLALIATRSIVKKGALVAIMFFSMSGLMLNSYGMPEVVYINLFMLICVSLFVAIYTVDSFR